MWCQRVWCNWPQVTRNTLVHIVQPYELMYFMPLSGTCCHFFLSLSIYFVQVQVKLKKSRSKQREEIFTFNNSLTSELKVMESEWVCVLLIDYAIPIDENPSTFQSMFRNGNHFVCNFFPHSTELAGFCCFGRPNCHLDWNVKQRGWMLICVSVNISPPAFLVGPIEKNDRDRISGWNEWRVKKKYGSINFVKNAFVMHWIRHENACLLRLFGNRRAPRPRMLLTLHLCKYVFNPCSFM